jgi:hypothetical protein
VVDIAEALQYAHERGVVHGNLHEGNVLLSEAGAKVGDFAMSSRARSKQPEDDLRALGEMMHRVTPQAAPGTDDALARIIDALRSGAYGSATDLLNDLRWLRPMSRTTGAQRPASRRLWPVAIIAVLVAVAAFGATRLGHRGPETTFVPGGRINGTPLHVSSVHDFDPFGDNHQENPALVHYIDDGQSATFWETENYTGSANFNGKKPGVGVIFDMGTAVGVGRSEVLFVGAPCNFEIRYSDSPSTTLDGWKTATTVTTPQLSTALQFSPHTARYWLLWITRLTKGAPGGRSSWACAVAEASLYAPKE